MKFEETELRLGLELGLPGGGCDQKEEENLCSEYNGNGKRNFAQTMDLKLNLAAATSDDENGRDNISCHQNPNNFHKQCSNDPLIKPPAKYTYMIFLIPFNSPFNFVIIYIYFAWKQKKRKPFLNCMVIYFI